MKNRTSIKLVSLLLVAAAACTLTSEAPPTLAPSTPIATITPDPGIAAPTLQFSENTIAPPVGVVESAPDPNTSPTNIQEVDANRMMGVINTLVSFQTRHILSTPGTSTGIQAAQNYLTNELQTIAASSPNDFLQIDVYPHQFQIEWGGQVVFPSNIVMAIQGTDATAGVVMVVAHYDTALQQWFEGDAFQPGANDNGSGVAALLEMARIMVEKPHRATLVFVLFSAEETGRQGSQIFVREFIQAQNIPLVAVLNMDIIGSPQGRRGERYDNAMRVFSEGPNDTSPSRQLARMIQVSTTRLVPDMELEVMDRTDRAGRWGDHMSFSDEGYPAVRFIQMAADATISHTTRDTIDRVDPNYLRRNTQVVLAALEMLADGPNPPTLRPLTPSATDPSSLTLEWSHNPVCQSYVIALRRPEALVYSEFYTVEATSLSWGGFKNFEGVTVGCVDGDGLLGRFAQELLITP